MNNIISIDALTMTSLEIVEVINEMREDGKAELRHDNFMTKIEKVLGKDALNFQGIYLDAMNREKPCYRLPKREASLMVMSESYAVQAKVYDRMTELEARAPALNPTNLTRLQLIQIAMEAEQEKLILEAVVADQAPKVEALDRIATFGEGSYCIRESAKLLQVQEKKLYQLLQEKHWIYKHPIGRWWLPYAPARENGYAESKMTEGTRADGSRWESFQTRITAKGLAKLSLVLVGTLVSSDQMIVSRA